MSAISRSLLSGAALLLEWNRLGQCQSEDELRTAYMGAFLHAREAHLSLILLREATPPHGFDKRLDLYLLPSWPPQQPAEAAGELKIFLPTTATDYRTRIGRRLSDIHYVHSLADEANLHGFFLDVVLNPKLVGQDCYDSLKAMCKQAADALYDPHTPTLPAALKDVKGIKAFADASLDRTPRQLLRRMPYGFLFPPMDLPGGPGHAKRGPAFVKRVNGDGLISIGVRKSGKEQIVPYRAVTTVDGVSGAVCFAVFEPGGKLAVNTDDLLAALAKR
jgi:hypothetical protein